MIMTKNNIGFKKFYKHIILFSILLIAGLYLIDFTVSQQKKRYLDMQTELLDNKYKTNYKYFKIMSEDIYSIYKDDINIISTISKIKTSDTNTTNTLRNKLYTKLKKRYKRLKNMGVVQLHFQLSDNTSFLRMHKPEKFGDDLTSFRDSVALTNKTKKAHDGFEVGKVTHSFRFVYPLFNKKEHIGSVEMSFSSQKLISSILDRTILHTHFLVSKDEVHKKLFENISTHLYEPSIENPEYLLDSTTHSMVDNGTIDKNIFNKEFTSKIAEIMKEEKAFSLSTHFNEESIVGSFIPIRDINNKRTLAYFAVYIESDYLDAIEMQKQYIKMLFTSILLLLFFFSVYVTMNNHRLEKMAHFDELTALPNRAYFYIEVEIEINRAKRLKNNLAVLFIDLDGFKAVNDTYGHDIGDDLLIEVSSRLLRFVRGVDIVARLGGDEFVVVLSDIKDDKDALSVANKIIKGLSQDFILNKQVINIGASIGISTFPTLAQDVDSLIKQSDSAMYVAKESGKNCAVIYS